MRCCWWCSFPLLIFILPLHLVLRPGLVAASTGFEESLSPVIVDDQLRQQSEEKRVRANGNEKHKHGGRMLKDGQQQQQQQQQQQPHQQQQKTQTPHLSSSHPEEDAKVFDADGSESTNGSFGHDPQQVRLSDDDKADEILRGRPKAAATVTTIVEQRTKATTTATTTAVEQHAKATTTTTIQTEQRTKEITTTSTTQERRPQDHAENVDQKVIKTSGEHESLALPVNMPDIRSGTKPKARHPPPPLPPREGTDGSNNTSGKAEANPEGPGHSSSSSNSSRSSSNNSNSGWMMTQRTTPRRRLSA